MPLSARTLVDGPAAEPWRVFATYLAPHKSRVLSLIALVVGSIGLNLVPPQLLKSFIDALRVAGKPIDLVVLALGYCGAQIGSSALSLLSQLVASRLAWAATNALREDLMGHCLRLDLQFHQRHGSGELLERLDGDVTVLEAFFSTFVGRLAGNVILLAGILLMLARENLSLALTFGAFSGLTIYGTERLRRCGQPAQEKFMAAWARLFGCLQEQLAAAEELRPLGAVSFSLREFSKRAFMMYRRVVPAQMLASWIVNSSLVAFYAANACALALGGYFFLGGAISLGAVYACYAYVEMLRRPIEALGNEMGTLGRVSASVKRISELRRRMPIIADEGSQSLPDGALGLSFEQVDFKYDPGPVALSRVSFELDPGESLGLIGRTGSGKSTLIKLIYRFYDATCGCVRMGGRPISQLKLSELRSRVAFVPQTPYLFDGTIFDNVSMLNARVSEDMVLEALREVGLGEWLTTRPRGLNSSVGSGGQGLSLGEAQLLALARVFVSNAGIVIVDEPTAALDPKSERLFHRGLKRLLRSRTAILITHRPETLYLVDKVLVLDKGATVAFAEQRDLLANSPFDFSKLLPYGEVTV